MYTYLDCEIVFIQYVRLHTEGLAYPLCGILVTTIFGNQLPQYFSMAIPGSS